MARGAKAAAAKSPAKRQAKQPEEEPAKASRHAERRDVVCKAERALQRRFPKKSYTEIAEIQGHCGKTWLQLVSEKFEKDPSSNSRIRDSVWREWQEQMEGPKDSDVQDAEKTLLEKLKQDISPKLWTAMGRARTQNCTQKSRKELLTYLEGCKSLNEKEFRGIAQHCIEREVPGANAVSQQLILSLMRTIR
eukprot:7857524-Lingulodinium_polyedra.AAC.1